MLFFRTNLLVIVCGRVGNYIYKTMLLEHILLTEGLIVQGNVWAEILKQSKYIKPTSIIWIQRGNSWS